MAITTRKATLHDILVLVDMMQEFYAEANYTLDREWASAGFNTLLSDDSLGAAWIVFNNSEAAGYVVLTVRFSMEYGGLDAFIDGVKCRADEARFGGIVIQVMEDSSPKPQ